jgi:hypothetical protein
MPTKVKIGWNCCRSFWVVLTSDLYPSKIIYIIRHKNNKFYFLQFGKRSLIKFSKSYFYFCKSAYNKLILLFLVTKQINTFILRKVWCLIWYTLRVAFSIATTQSLLLSPNGALSCGALSWCRPVAWPTYIYIANFGFEPRDNVTAR